MSEPLSQGLMEVCRAALRVLGGNRIDRSPTLQRTHRPAFLALYTPLLGQNIIQATSMAMAPGCCGFLLAE